jgi:hypothetical protein
MVGTNICDGSSQKFMFVGAVSLLYSFKGEANRSLESMVMFTILLKMSFNAVVTSIFIDSHKM